ncbi:autotransporter assembly complex family protein [Erythrobacter sp.]|uniref:autotransporter assembly complex protein TamA n=1 Tax=Erythrobacter sp. TaxID=1042 RepID=UPI001425D6AA|nr:BamA/TamA family outer membrane protein [Erythrobacter sp.]QIQ86958.1 MAG: BamA/TamA family outer membrane protein [Erythrobacter sp.]
MSPEGSRQARLRRWARFAGASCFALALAGGFALDASPACAQQADPAPEPTIGSDEPIEIPPPPPGAQLPEPEPIITEEEFERRVPDLAPEDDPAFDEPLETIEEFERRMAGAPAQAEPPRGTSEPAPLGEADLADGDPIEAIGDAPISDRALTDPLQPLESFELEPVTFEDDGGPPAEPAEIPYEIVLAGLEEADAETAANLRDRFFELSALEAGDGDAANIAQLNARLAEDAELAKRLLAAQGWFGARVRTRLVRGEGEDDASPLVARIEIDPGRRYSFAEINIDAPPIEPPDLIRETLALEVGAPIVATKVQAAEARVAVRLPQEGYPFVEIGTRDILLDRDTGGGVYTLPVDPGPRSVFGGIETSGDLAFGAEHIAEIARFERGEPYDSRMLNDLRKALVATGLFDTVAVYPQPTGEEAGEGREYARIRVEQDAGPPRTIAGNAGFGTGRGFSVEGSWTHRNLFPPEGALSVRALAGTQEQAVGASFRRSNAGRRDRTFEITADALRSDFEAFQALTGRIAALVRYDSTPIWQKRITYAYGARLIISSEEDFNDRSLLLRRRLFKIVGLTGQLGYDTTDSLLDPTEGFRLTALVEPEGSFEQDFTPYVRAQFDGSAYYPAGDSLVLAGRVRLGTIQGIDRFSLAPSRRFYAGGGGSVRGFGFQELGPRLRVVNPNFPDPGEIEPGTDPEDLPDPFVFRPIGGRSLFEAAAEVRYRFGDYGIAAFVDAGQVYQESLPQFDDIRFGVGIGGRYYTNFGPVRVDVAVPIDRRTGESSFAVYVSIGQAF